MRKLVLLFLSLFMSVHIHAQNINKIIVDQDANGRNLYSYLEAIEDKYAVDFVGAETQLKSFVISGVDKPTYMYSFLDQVLETFGLTAVKVKENVLFIIDKQASEEFGKRKGNYLLINSQNSGRLTGVVTESGSNNRIPGSQVVIPGTGKGTLTNEQGQYDLAVPSGEVFRLDIQYLGYDTKSYLVGFSPYGEEYTIDASLITSSMELEGVVVTADRSDQTVRSKVAGVERLDIEAIKELPTFFGEVDPIRSLATLPGISISGEIASGFNVRGGQSGQNLLIQDDAIIYNPTHLFGFFSAFNPDMVSNVELYKGGGPATFGGRVSSVLDVKLRNGDAGRISVKGGIGMISSRLSVEGPVIKDKSTLLIGGRVSYADWLLKATDNIDLRNSSADFYDVNMKYFHTINDNNFISISG